MLVWMIGGHLLRMVC